MTGALLFMGLLFWLTNRSRNLDGIKAKTVGDGQHGTARWATKSEIRKTFTPVPFRPELWRAGKEQPKALGVILGSNGKPGSITALVDTDDVHTLMIGASGVGKTAYFLYPNLEYACACGMSFLCTDTKGDLARNYGGVARDCYGYQVAVIDLRNPTRSHGNNMLHLVNRYMDAYRAQPQNISLKARAEKYAKIISKTIISASGDEGSHGQNQFFYDAAEGLLTSVILLLAEYLPPTDDEPQEKRHIISVFKLVQELLEPSNTKGKSQFQLLMVHLPDDHKAKWFAGAALNAAEQAMLSIMSTVLSRLNAFLDTQLEQILCFDTAIDAEKFCHEKSAIFLIMPEENPTTYFLVSLLIQQLYREILTIADEQGGKLPNRVLFYCDELGTMPAIESLELVFSASRSRGLLMVPIIQSLAQLEKNYGKEGEEIIIDNCADAIFGGFAPNSQTAEALSKALGSRTVMSGCVNVGKERGGQLQMMERPLLTPDELKSMPKGHFVVMKTGTHPMQTRLRLFKDWGITFGAPFIMPEQATRQVAYANKEELERSIIRQRYTCIGSEGEAADAPTPAPKRKPDPANSRRSGVKV